MVVNPGGAQDIPISEFADIDPTAWNHYHTLSGLLQFPTTRFGKELLPFKNNLMPVLGDQAPAYQADFDETWTQVTDHRYHQLRSTHFARPWLLFWSGGIDSTVQLVSILRNASKQDRENITVVCNNASVAENPRFFLDHVRPNFKIVSSEDTILDRHTLSKYYAVNGHPADALWCQFSGSVQALNLQQPGLLFKDPAQHDRLVINSMIRLFDCQEDFAQWLYSTVMENIKSQSIPVQTVHDFFWYMSFNYSWSGTKLREMLNIDTQDPDMVALFWSGVVFWYDTDQYQLWSMANNQPGIKYGVSLADYKWTAKQYIHSYDGDEYYLNFKTKISSIDHRFYKRDDRSFFCMLDDFSKLYLPTDLETIGTLMRDFVVDK